MGTNFFFFKKVRNWIWLLFWLVLKSWNQHSIRSHLYVDIGDASSSLWGSTSSFFIFYFFYLFFIFCRVWRATTPSSTAWPSTVREWWCLGPTTAPCTSGTGGQAITSRSPRPPCNQVTNSPSSVALRGRGIFFLLLIFFLLIFFINFLFYYFFYFNFFYLLFFYFYYYYLFYFFFFVLNGIKWK